MASKAWREGGENCARLPIDPFADAFLHNPYAHHARIRDAGAVIWLDSIGCFAMARHAEVQAALKDWGRFASGRGVGLADFAREQPWRPPSLLLEADPPLHDRTRAIMQRIVSIAAVKALRPSWQAKAERLADELVARRRFDAVADLAEMFPMQVFPDTLGLPQDGREHLLVYAATVFNGFGPRNARVTQRGVAEAAAEAWVADACRRDRLTPGGWGAQVYAAADEGLCDAAEAARLVRSLISAGVDTTVNGLGNMLHAFARFPAEWARLRADPSLARRAFEESLRWDSTVQTFFRTTAVDVEVGGVTIPQGSKVLLFLAAANRDPRRWDDAERFDIGRQASGHVGFGFGIHQCLGQMVARLEAEVMLEALVPRVVAIRLAGPIERRLNNTLHAIARLPVELEPA